MKVQNSVRFPEQPQISSQSNVNCRNNCMHANVREFGTTCAHLSVDQVQQCQEYPVEIVTGIYCLCYQDAVERGLGAAWNETVHPPHGYTHTAHGQRDKIPTENAKEWIELLKTSPNEETGLHHGQNIDH